MKWSSPFASGTSPGHMSFTATTSSAKTWPYQLLLCHLWRHLPIDDGASRAGASRPGRASRSGGLYVLHYLGPADGYTGSPQAVCGRLWRAAGVVLSHPGQDEEIQRLRRTLGVYDRDPGIDTDKAQHTGRMIDGNETIGRWGAVPARLAPERIVRAVLTPGTPWGCSSVHVQARRGMYRLHVLCASEQVSECIASILSTHATSPEFARHEEREALATTPDQWGRYGRHTSLALSITSAYSYGRYNHAVFPLCELLPNRGTSIREPSAPAWQGLQAPVALASHRESLPFR